MARPGPGPRGSGEYEDENVPFLARLRGDGDFSRRLWWVLRPWSSSWPRALSWFSAHKCIPLAPCAESLCSLSFRSLDRTLLTQAGARRPIPTASRALGEVLQLHERVPAREWDRALIPRARVSGTVGAATLELGNTGRPLCLCRRHWAC